MARVLRNQVRGAAISSSQRRLTYVRPRGVKGGCGRQADGTAGLPPAPEIPVRFVTYASCQAETSSGRKRSQVRDRCLQEDGDRTSNSLKTMMQDASLRLPLDRRLTGDRKVY
jgi:hypothetical protein